MSYGPPGGQPQLDAAQRAKLERLQAPIEATARKMQSAMMEAQEELVRDVVRGVFREQAACTTRCCDEQYRGAEAFQGCMTSCAQKAQTVGFRLSLVHICSPDLVSWPFTNCMFSTLPPP